jgi:hypothetical protein
MKKQATVVSLQDKVQVLLDTAGSEVLETFFGSDTPEINKWTKEGSETEVFVNTAKGLNIDYEHVDNHGGEGKGEDYWSVHKFTHGTESVYVKFSGSYQSYDGSDYDEWFFVVPKTVEVVQFFRAY